MSKLKKCGQGTPVILVMNGVNAWTTGRKCVSAMAPLLRPLQKLRAPRRQLWWKTPEPGPSKSPLLAAWLTMQPASLLRTVVNTSRLFSSIGLTLLLVVIVLVTNSRELFGRNGTIISLAL